ncbi:MAG: Helix-turn-helix domain [Thermoplasmata archaeon]|nr:Helix-turn-helix domain [Thermoplasmata archaeon]
MVGSQSTESQRTPAAIGRQRARLLTNRMRAGILEIVHRSPGILQGRLVDEAGCSRATVRHHLAALHRAGLVRVVSSSQRAAVFPATMQFFDQDAWAALQRGRTLELAQKVRREPGLVQSDITRQLGMTRKVFRKYVDAMLAQGLLEEVEEPPFKTYYPTSALLRILDSRDEPATAQPPTALGFEHAGRGEVTVELRPTALEGLRI